MLNWRWSNEPWSCGSACRQRAPRPNPGLEPSRRAVLCDHVTTARGSSRTLGGQNEQRTLPIQPRSATSASTPERPDDHVLFVERVIKVAGNFWNVDAANVRDAGLRIQGPGTGQPCQDPKGFFKLGDEHVGVDSVFQPPLFLASNVPACRGRKSDPPGIQRDLSSLRISSCGRRRFVRS